MKTELMVKLRLDALHSLDERDTPHKHVWDIIASFQGPITQGRIISMPQLRERLDPYVNRLRGTFLNENQELDEDSRRYPTCECLAGYFATHFSLAAKEWNGVKLSWVEVSVREPNGEMDGGARLSLD